MNRKQTQWCSAKGGEGTLQKREGYKLVWIPEERFFSHILYTHLLSSSFLWLINMCSMRNIHILLKMRPLIQDERRKQFMFSSWIIILKVCLNGLNTFLWCLEVFTGRQNNKIVNRYVKIFIWSKFIKLSTSLSSLLYFFSETYCAKITVG